MKVSLEEINNFFDFGSVQRGKEYFQSNKIFNLSYETQNNKDVVIRSKSRGKSRQQYQQEILLENQSDLYIYGRCSCYLGSSCKHIYGALLLYLQKIQKRDPNFQANKWLETIVNFSEEDDFNNLNREYFLIYRLLNSDENSYYQEDIKFCKAKYLKSGKLSKGIAISCDNILYSYNHEDIKNTEDKEILDLCRAFIPKWNRRSEEIKGKIGTILLKELVKTQRCFYKDGDIPLQFHTEILKVDFFWEDVDENYSKFSSNLTKEYKIIGTEPLIVLNTKNSTLHETDLSTSKEFINHLTKAPKISNKTLNRAYKTLIKFPEITHRVSPPKTFKVKEIQSALIPHLKISKERDKEERDFYGMRLYFKYDEHLLDPYPANKQFSFFDKETQIIIKRDLEKEEESIVEILSSGFLEYENYSYFKIGGATRQESLQKWQKFLEKDLIELQKRGWEVEFLNDLSISFSQEFDLEIDTEEEEGNQWFELSFNVEIGGEKRSLVNLIAPIIEEFDDLNALPKMINIEVEEDNFLTVEKEELKPILQTIFQLFDKRDDEGKIKVAPYEAHFIEFDDTSPWKGNQEILELSQKLKNFSTIESVTPPKSLQGTLREYQQQGVNWLNFLYEFRFNGILADDMGLGKTIQTLTHLSKLKEEGKLTQPALIIVPTSLIANWKNETKIFTPNLTILTLYGNKRAQEFSKIQKSDLILTTYALVQRDLEKLLEYEFSYVILDEAQKIKNHKTKASKAIRSLKTTHKLALSGTPIENHLGELWSIFLFLMPGFLDTEKFFKNYYQNPIEKENSIEKRELLNKRVKPFIIRRKKEEVAKELPEKSEIIKYTQFGDKQSKLYESIRVTMEKKVRDAVSKKGLDRSHITLLDALLKLRQVCCDPSLLKIDEAKKVKESAKMELLFDLLDELLSEEKKILLFSQFTSVLSIIEKELQNRKISYVKLTGSSTNREDIINKFKKDDVNIFLISLKAGGVGLNLVEADTVIHYDPWWNPAVENQATDRAYRIGQTKAVFVYKLIVENSIEEKIINLQKKKQSLQEGIYEKSEESEEFFNKEELLELLQ